MPIADALEIKRAKLICSYETAQKKPATKPIPRFLKRTTEE